MSVLYTYVYYVTIIYYTYVYVYMYICVYVHIYETWSFSLYVSCILAPTLPLSYVHFPPFPCGSLQIHFTLLLFHACGAIPTWGLFTVIIFDH